MSHFILVEVREEKVGEIRRAIHAVGADARDLVLRDDRPKAASLHAKAAKLMDEAWQAALG